MSAALGSCKVAVYAFAVYARECLNFPAFGRATPGCCQVSRGALVDLRVAPFSSSCSSSILAPPEETKLAAYYCYRAHSLLALLVLWRRASLGVGSSSLEACGNRRSTLSCGEELPWEALTREPCRARYLLLIRLLCSGLRIGP